MATLRLKDGVVSTDEDIQEAPGTWAARVSKAKCGDDTRHIAELEDGSWSWVIQGVPRTGNFKLAPVPSAMTPRNAEPKRWEDVPKNTYVPSERLKAMDVDEVDTHTFFPNIAGLTNN